MKENKQTKTTRYVPTNRIHISSEVVPTECSLSSPELIPNKVFMGMEHDPKYAD